MSAGPSSSRNRLVRTKIRKGHLQQRVVEGEPDVLTADGGGVAATDTGAGPMYWQVRSRLAACSRPIPDKVNVQSFVHPGDLEELLLRMR